MITSKSLPIARVKVWGNPWHGRVQGGQLHLPNGTTRAYVATLSASRHSGDTFLLQVPGCEPVDRTEELAADTAAGRQWWNRAILSTRSLHLYGKPLNGWIYIDQAGDRWHVSAPRSVALAGNSYSGTVTLSRFGAIGVPAEQHSYPVSLADLGQSTPSLFDLVSNSMRLVLRDITPDGAKALYAIEVQRASSLGWPGGSTQANRDWPPVVGWLELSLSGGGAQATVTLAVLRNREQAIGTRTASYVKSGEFSAWELKHDVSYSNSEGQTVTTAVPRIAVVSGANPVGWSTGDGHGGLALSQGWFGTDLSTTKERAVVGLWYGADGVIREVEFETIQLVEKVAVPPTFSATGQRVRVTDNTTGQTTVSSVYTLSSTPSTITETATDRVRLLLDGVQVSAAEQSSVKQFVADIQWQRSSGGFYSAQLYQDGAPSNGHWLSLTNSAQPETTTTNTSYLSMGEQGFKGLPYPHSNHAWSLVELIDNGDSYSYRFHPAITPSGQAGTTTDIAFVSGLEMYGSWCPVTHQFARSTTPVVWT